MQTKQLFIAAVGGVLALDIDVVSRALFWSNQRTWNIPAGLL